MFEINILNLILIGLIFLSLVVIIGILGRNIKKIKEFQAINGKEALEKLPKGKNLAGRIVNSFLNIIKNIFIAVAEWIVKHAKNLLHLVHFWLIKLRKGKNGNGTLRSEIEAKEELINEEEKNLNKVIYEDLGRADEEDVLEEVLEKKAQQKKEIELQESNQKVDIADKEGKVDLKGFDGGVPVEEPEVEKDSKIKNFFSRKKDKSMDIVGDLDLEENEIEEGAVPERAGEFAQEDELQFEQEVEEEKKESAIKKIFGKLNVFSKKKGKDGQMFDEQQVDEVGDLVDDDFSDGVVKIKKPQLQPDEDLLMKEVVASSQNKRYVDQYDELGVDRKILEKKILQKISSNPKNLEHYRQLGELYIKMKNFSDAEDTYKFILNATPRDADARRKIEKIKLLKRLN
ncbi:MAG: hypothetical protein U9O20_03025 [Patescibacteria group bacterium]|nr:hypothetical protein [Patescibacteria group bacterium]